MTTEAHALAQEILDKVVQPYVDRARDADAFINTQAARLAEALEANLRLERAASKRIGKLEAALRRLEEAAKQVPQNAWLATARANAREVLSGPPPAKRKEAPSEPRERIPTRAECGHGSDCAWHVGDVCTCCGFAPSRDDLGEP